MRRPDCLMPRAENARGRVRGALPRTPARGVPPETPGPLSLPPHVPERSSPSRWDEKVGLNECSKLRLAVFKLPEKEAACETFESEPGCAQAQNAGFSREPYDRD
jgi:hypothetical protein